MKVHELVRKYLEQRVDCETSSKSDEVEIVVTEYLKCNGIVNSEYSIPLNLFSKKSHIDFKKYLDSLEYTNDQSDSQMSLIASIRDFYVHELLSGNIDENVCFSTLLSSCVERSSLPMPKIAKEVDLSLSTFYAHFYGKRFPSNENHQYFKNLDKFFGLPEGSFRKSAGHVLYGESKKIHLEAKITKKGLTQKDCTQKADILKLNQFPQSLKVELDLIIRFYTTLNFENDFPGLNRKETAVWKSIGYDGKASITTRLFERFFGFVINTCKTQSVSLTAGLLINPGLIEKYVDFREKQVGFLSPGIEEDVKTIQAFVKNNHGVIQQNISVFAAKYFSEINSVLFQLNLGPDVSRSWEEACQRSSDFIEDYLKNKKFELVDDEDEMVAFITQSFNPQGEVKKIIEKIKFDATTRTRCNKSPSLYRDFLIVVFVFVFRFRPNTYAELNLKTNFNKRADGLWELVMPINQLEHSRNFKSDYMTYPLPATLSLYVDTYLNEHRQNLYGSESDNFFLSSNSSGPQKAIGVTGRNIVRIFQNTMQKYSPNGCVFSPAAACRIMDLFSNQKWRINKGSIDIVNTQIELLTNIGILDEEIFLPQGKNDEEISA